MLMNIINNMFFKNPIFYNPKISCMSYKVTAGCEGLNVTISRALNTNSGRPQKGDNCYDHQNAASFTLNLDDVISLVRAMPSIYNGTYNNPNCKDDKPYQFKLTHFRDKKPSFFIAEKARDSSGNITSGVKFTIIPPKSTGGYAFYIMRENEYVIFKTFAENFARYTEFISSVLSAILSTIRQGNFRANDKK
jgi:hypothetical protein